MALARKIIDLPATRPSWEAFDRRSELVYLGWGLRSYGRHPTQPIANEQWSYSVILKGAPIILLEQGPYRLAPSQMIVVAPHRRYQIGFRDEPDAHAEVLIWIWRTPPLVREIRPPLGGHLLVQLDGPTRKRLEALHAACRREVSHFDSFTAKAIRGLRLQIDTELVRRLVGHNTTPDRRRLLDLAVHWMESNLRHANPVFLLCDYLQISRSTLNEIFDDAFKESPSVHYRRLRMKKGADLLDQGASVKEVAFKLGYKHANDFSRAFRSFRRHIHRR
jgi:AraC-like DNA-binding protein